ncbi:MAG: ATP-binding cassette domain-containing protein [Lachnospiraceae bacterium]|nr:ATP-binding cassette domain-containing protein [Lachnospiraceae bacterium]
MLLSIMLGVNGFLCAISLTILAAAKLLEGLSDSLSSGGVALEGAVRLPIATGSFFVILFLVAVLRGVLHYGEQYCNHFIAFKLLAIVRHKVFANLRRLCPAKLEGKDRGDLISIITSDIELLEVFYAHTISPIAIAVIVSIFMTAFIGRQSALAGLLACIAYLTVGVAIPLAIGRAGGERGLAFRNGFGELNSYVLDSIRGVDETIQYDGGEMRRKDIADRSVRLSKLQRGLAGLEATQTSLTNAAILIFSFVMLFFMMYEYKEGNVTFSNVLLATVSMMGSFGPVLALSNLANSLNQTLAAGERVLSILEEEPQVVEVTDGMDVEAFDGAGAYGVTFAYDEHNSDYTRETGRNKKSRRKTKEESSGKSIKLAGVEDEAEDAVNAKAESSENILSDYTIEIPKGKVVGIYGASGSGKSTLLRLLMRFWDVNSGQIRLSGVDIREINTASLRDMESYVEQDTYLFHDSIANNIAIGRLDATREEIVEAAKKASIHEFIMTLPDGYDTEVGELGDTLSGGERQRIGIARAFLHDAPLMLLDEPTSNLDSLNEGIILKSLAESMRSGEKTVLLVSHRKSTLSIADRIYKMESGRLS